VQLLSVPTGGGIVVGVLNYFRNNMFMPSIYTSKKSSQNDQKTRKLATEMKEFLEPVLKSLAALVTLGTGNSLGPEGPSVEIGASIANGLGTAFKSSRERKMSLIAAGSAAGISSGVYFSLVKTF
jgi:H+/Cl- antiporter ClcA